MSSFDSFDMVAGLVSVFPFIQPTWSSPQWADVPGGTGVTNLNFESLARYAYSIMAYHDEFPDKSRLKLSLVGIATGYRVIHSPGFASLHFAKRVEGGLDAFWRIYDEFRAGTRQPPQMAGVKVEKAETFTWVDLRKFCG